jgi:hypothetical protein
VYGALHALFAVIPRSRARDLRRHGQQDPRTRPARQGLGSEGARLLLCHGLTNSRVDRVWAGTGTANLASRATLAALGLECTAEPFPGVLTYEITHDQWAARAAGNS